MKDADDIFAMISTLLDDPPDPPSVIGAVRAKVRSAASVWTSRAEQAKVEARADAAIAHLDSRRQIVQAAIAAKEAEDDARFREFISHAPRDVQKKILESEIEKERLLTERQRQRTTRAGYAQRERQITDGYSYTAQMLLEAGPGAPDFTTGMEPTLSEEELDATAMRTAAKVMSLPPGQAEEEIGKFISGMRSTLGDNVVADIEQRISAYRRKLL